MSNERPKVVAVIPARYASQRLPAKPLVEIAGKPMIQHVYENASLARRVDAAMVATDDERILSVVHGFGGSAVMTPASLQSGTDRVAHVARAVPDAEIIVNLQGDEPLMSAAMIDEAVRPLVADDRLEVGTLVRRIDSGADLSNPGIVKVVLDHDCFCLYFSRSVIPFVRDRVPHEWVRHHLFFKHLGIYVYRREALLRFASMAPSPLEKAEKLEQLRLLENGYRIKASVTTEDSVPVDTAQDLETVRGLVQRKQ